ncbi:hypothetical protein NLG97_g7114 [Lecanicillium saksenae]|uniref:Uncharacterized protein n=1 Tax=Lecanicillium saksenae TaxID=468837 RepID=A0ACC1QQR2_9HYPO|nr:hypothetical protein NLG97_g7114 [Lecanicillium saksenae]
MKFSYTLLTFPIAVLAVPNLMEPVHRRDNGSEKIQQLLSGVAQAVVCFDIALDKAGLTKSGAVVPTQPPGVDCAAIISLANGGSAGSSGASGSGKPTETSTGSSSAVKSGSESSVSATGSTSSGSATGSSSTGSTTGGPSSTSSMSSTGSSSAPSATSSK